MTINNGPYSLLVAPTILINFPCALGSLPYNLLFANGAGGVQYYFHRGFQIDFSVLAA